MSPLTTRAENNSIRENVYHVIKTNIAKLQLAPGITMSTQELAEKLNVSRTPVREAFIRLQKEDLVVIAPQKNTMVSLIDLVRAEKERFLRESLEAAIIPLFMEKFTNADLHELDKLLVKQKACYDADDSLTFLSYDNLFHKVFFDVAEQDLSWETITSTNSHYNRLRVLTTRNKETFYGAVCQHEVMLQYIRAGNTDALRKELLNHVQKINIEKTGLLEQFPDYFAMPEKSNPLLVNVLL